MNAVTTVRQPSPTERFVADVLPPERKSELYRALPRHITPDRFERNLYNALMQTPALLQYDPRLVFREVSKAAALGLLLDPQLGEAYLIESWNSKSRQKEPQLRVGYRGLIKLARQSGEISQIYAHEVCQNDEIIAELGDNKRLIHKPDLFGDRGPVVGFYAVVRYSNGETDFEPLSIQQAHEIRDRTDAWKAFTEGKIKSTPWATDESEMAKKTVIRRLMKRIPQSPELQEAVKLEDQADFQIDAAPVQRRVAEPPSPPRVTHLPHAAVVGPPAAKDAEVSHAAPTEEASASPPDIDAPDPAPDPIDPEEVLAELDEHLLTASAPEHCDEILDLFSEDLVRMPEEQSAKAYEAIAKRKEELSPPKEPPKPERRKRASAKTPEDPADDAATREASRQRVESAGGKGVAEYMNDDRHDDALAQSIDNAAASQPFDIPQQFSSVDDYRGWIDRAIKAVQSPETAARLKDVWAQTKDARELIGIPMPMRSEIQKVIVAKIAPYEPKKEA